jgi:hypothetical protein
LALTFVPSVATKNANATKNVAARFVQLSMSFRGSQMMLPYRTAPALVTAMPMKQQSVNATGMMIT